MRFIVRWLLRHQQRKAVPRTDDVWPLLAKTQATTSNGLTTEDNDPTSVEFEQKFGDLMKDVLTGERNLILVLDNLDRVDAEDARRIWATMQTFLQSSEHNTRSWFPQLWVIVPYDRDGISRLWGTDSEVNVTPSRKLPLREFFLDKSLQIRFDVPPPVVSRWRERLSKLLSDAIKGHTESEFYEVVRTYSDFPDLSNPTPREMTLFVNQLGSIHRQWCIPGLPDKTIPLHHMAYYILLRRTKTSREIIEDIRTKQIVGTKELIQDLSALAFNVNRPDAQQLLIGDDVEEALRNGLPDELRDLADIPCFLEVLDDVDLAKLIGNDGAVLANVAHAICESGCFSEPRDARQQRIVNHLNNVLLATTADGKPTIIGWGMWDNEISLKVGAVLRLSPNPDVAARVLEIVSNTDPTKGVDEQAIMHWTSATLCMIKLIRRLRLYNCLAAGIAVPGGAAAYLAVLEAILHNMRSDKAALIRPAADVDEPAIVGAMKDDVVNFAPVPCLAVQPLAIDLFEMKSKGVSLSELVGAMQERLASAESPPEYAAQLLMNLRLLRAANQEARAALSAVNSGGFTLHHLNTAFDKPNFRSVAACLLSYAADFPKAEQPSAMPLAANSGFARIKDGFGNQREEVAKEMAVFAVKDGTLAAPFGLLEGEDGPKSIGLTCLRIAAKSTKGKKLFSLALVAKHWKALRDGWGNVEYNRFIKTIEEHTVITTNLVSETFNQIHSGFYWSIVEALSDVPAQFTEWCCNGLNSINSKLWVMYLKGSYWQNYLLTALISKGARMDLSNGFKDALVSLCAESMQVEAINAKWIPHIPDLIAALSPSARLQFLEGVIDAAKARNGIFAPDFFENWQAALRIDLSDPEEIRRGLWDIVVDVVFTHRTLDSLNWVHQTLSNGARLEIVATKTALARIRREAKDVGARETRRNMKDAMQRIETRVKEMEKSRR